jgi:transcriptional accessory protein Tex/SPT6
VYRLGQSVQVKVEEADIVSKRVTFSLADKKPPQKKTFSGKKENKERKSRSFYHSKPKSKSGSYRNKSKGAKGKKKR